MKHDFDINEDILRELFTESDWRSIIRDPDVVQEYNEYPTLALLKACALPYLLNIPSERSLARLLDDHELLQEICGFEHNESLQYVNVPSRATLWHFRRTYDGEFRWWLLRVLAVLVHRAQELDIRLPFETNPPREGNFVKRTFPISGHNITAEIWAKRREDRHDRVDPKQKVLEFPNFDLERLNPDHASDATRRRLADDVGLPAELIIRNRDTGSSVRTGVSEPSWHYVDLHVYDRLMNVSGDRKRPYAACNILVFRGTGENKQILLARRLHGFGKDQFAAPGGKKKKRETVEECAKRELFEETRLRMLAGTPVSIRVTDYNEKPKVISVGVAVEESGFEGDPQWVETKLLGEWKWHHLSNLPNNIFEPTRIALNDYLENATTKLSWNNVEMRVRENIDGNELTLWDL